MKLYLKEAVYKALSLGIPTPKQRIKDELWKGRTQETQNSNYSNLTTGRVKATPEAIKTFKDICGVSYQFIFEGE